MIPKLVASLTGMGTSKRSDNLESGIPPQSSGTVQAIPVRRREEDTVFLHDPPAYEFTTDAASTTAFVSGANEKTTFGAVQEKKTLMY